MQIHLPDHRTIQANLCVCDQDSQIPEALSQFPDQGFKSSLTELLIHIDQAHLFHESEPDDDIALAADVERGLSGIFQKILDFLHRCADGKAD